MDRLEAKLKKLLLKWGVKEDEAVSFLEELKQAKDEEDGEVEESKEEVKAEESKEESKIDEDKVEEHKEESGVVEGDEEVDEVEVKEEEKKDESVEGEVKGDEPVETEEKVESEEVVGEEPKEEEKPESPVESQVEEKVEEEVEQKDLENDVVDKGQDMSIDTLRAENEELKKTCEGLGARIDKLEELVAFLGKDVPESAGKESGVELSPHAQSKPKDDVESYKRRAMGYYE